MIDTWIKICGLTDRYAIAAAVEANVQAIGFVFAESVRKIDPQRAQQLSAAIPDEIAKVAVFLKPGQDEVDRVYTEFQPDYVQADWSALRELALPVGVQVLPVCREGEGIGKQSIPEPYVYEGALSGQGQTVDWSDARQLARSHRLILAGGLSPANVGEAIRAVQPFGVDVSSGVENRRGHKDPQLIKEFVQQVRLAATDLPCIKSHLKIRN